MAARALRQTTILLADLANGDQHAADRLMPLVYEELRALADSYFRRQASGLTLQPTALVHEAYLRLIDQSQASYKSRSHFMAVAAMAMRQILIDRARKMRSVKHGGGMQRVTLDEAAVAPDLPCEVDLLKLEQALTNLAKLDDRKSRVVELRFFGGLSIEAAAEVLGVARSTITEDWRFARAWLVCELQDESKS